MDYKQNLDKILLELDSRIGSDVHFNVGKYPAIRVDGNLNFLETENILTKEDVEMLNPGTFYYGWIDEEESG